jgi:hypothetical protein
MNINNENLNEFGWIYLCIDVRDPYSFKVGLTKANNIFDRISDTTNPYYLLVRGYRIPDFYISNPNCTNRSFRESDWYYLERYIHKELEKIHHRVTHCMKGSLSEWFEGDLEYALGQINYYFFRTVSLLDEDGNPPSAINDYIYDPIINSVYFYNRLAKFSNRNHYIQKLEQHFCNTNQLFSNTTLAQVLHIHYIT